MGIFQVTPRAVRVRVTALTQLALALAQAPTVALALAPTMDMLTMGILILYLGRRATRRATGEWPPAACPSCSRSVVLRSHVAVERSVVA